MSISIYYLRRFGLSHTLANSLSMDEVELLDLFLKKNDKLLELYTNKKVDKLKNYLKEALLNMSNGIDIFDEIFMLESCGINLGTSKIYEKSISISEYKMLLKTVDWKSEGLLLAAEKLRKQIEDYNQVLELESNMKEISRWYTYLYFLKNTFIEDNQIENEGLDRKLIIELLEEGYLELDKSGSIFVISIDNLSFYDEILDVFKLDRNYYIENKREEKQNIKECVTMTLNDYLSSDFNRKEILLLRLEGKSLKEVGDEFGITRERVRQIVNKTVNTMPSIYEVQKYSEVFSKYMISKEIFINIFCSDGRVYELLTLVSKKGELDISKYILEGDFDEKAKQYIIANSRRFIEKGNYKKLPREYIIGEILQRNKHLQKYFSLEDIYYLYNEEIEDYPKLSISSIRGLDSLLDRCSNVIFSFKEGYRFHSIDYTKEIGDKLIKIILSITDGAYSMNYIYENNLETMEKLDILNGSELHYFIKKYVDIVENINLGRNPEFVKGNLTKKEYVLSELKYSNGDSVDNFVEYMNSNFGLNSDSLLSYVFNNFPENIVNRTIFFKSNYKKEQIEEINSVLTEEIYEKNEFYNIINKYVLKDEVSNELFFELGYAEKRQVVIKLQYKSASEAFEKYILSKKVFQIEDRPIFKTNEYFNTIQKLEKDLKVLKISKDSYINIKYLEERGFDKNRFLKFISSIDEFIKDDKYFSITSLINDGFYDSLLDDGFELISLDRLISISGKVKAVSVGFPNIYCCCDSKKNLNDFLIDELFKWGKADVSDFTDDINSKYGLNLDEYKVRLRLIDAGAYYSDILNKAYIIKEDYLNEVYGE